MKIKICNSFNKIMLFMASFVLFITATMTPVVAQESIEATIENKEYEIYPIVQSTKYENGSFDLKRSINVMLSDEADEPTQRFLEKVLKEHKITYTLNEDSSEGDVTLYAGVLEDGSIATDEIMKNVSVDPQLSDNFDYYNLKISDDSIYLLGRDTDALFHAVTSLKAILEQEESSIRNLTITDYSETAIRGFIEGFYGTPWTNEDRMSLMRFGGNFKMNAYLFAPKNDEYHNEKWREPYPEDMLPGIKEMVEVGAETKNRFVWTIHPFMTEGVRFDTEENYQEDLEAIKFKFNSLYDVGVRQFGVLADDVSAQAANPTNQVKLMKDIHEWNKTKDGNYNLIFVPSQYNKADANRNPNYYPKINELPEDIHVMWTGDSVMGKVTQGTIDHFRKIMPGNENTQARNPFFWLNWPVSDFNQRRLVMGPTEMVTPGVKNLDGIVSNPMHHAEASKVGLFAIADYGWNSKSFKAQQSWEDSMKYIEPNAGSSLEIVSRHLNDPSPNSQGIAYKESEDLRERLENFTRKINSNTATISEAQNLISEFEVISNAANDVLSNGANKNLINEIGAWLKSLTDISKATISYLETFIALEENNIDGIWSSYSNGLALNDRSERHEIMNIIGVERAEAGAKRLVPFMNNLKKQLSPRVNELIGPDVKEDKELVVLSPKVIKSDDFESYYQGTDNSLIDNNERTHVWYKTKNGEVKVGGYIGLDLGQEVYLNTIRFLQGTVDNTDIFEEAYLEVSRDNVRWERIAGPFSTKETDLNISSQNIKARYVRFVNTVRTGKWYAARELTVTGFSPQRPVYTNAKYLRDYKFEYGEDQFTFTNVSEITLEPNEYIGVDMSRVREVLKIDSVFDNNELDVLTGLNPIEMTEFDNTVPLNARYVVIKNNTEEPQTVNLEKIDVKTKEVSTIKLIDTNVSNVISEVAALDRNKNTLVTFDEKQKEGQYAIYDLGQDMDIEKLSVVVRDIEEEYPEHLNISLSQDGQNFEEAMIVGDGIESVIAGIYPERDVAYLSTSKDGINQTARYLKLEILSTPQTEKRTTLSEILINDGQYFEPINNPEFDYSPREKEGSRPENMFDADFATAFTPNTEGISGFLNYQVSSNNDINQLVVLQGSYNISNAKVSARSEDGWKTIGVLDKSYNEIDIKGSKHIFEFKFEWSGEHPTPVIYEMYTKSIVDKTELIELIATAESLIESDYDTQMWIVFWESLEKARAVVLDPEVKNADINDMIEKLQSAIDGLTVNEDVLAAVVKAEAERTLESVETAKELVQNLSDSEIKSELLERLDAVSKIIDVTNLLKEEFDKADQIERGEYTEDTYNHLQKVLEEVKVHLERNSSSLEELEGVLSKLTEAVDSLEEEIQELDKSTLRKLVNELKELLETDYTEETVAVVKSVMEEAQIVLDDENVTQARVDEISERLTEAKEALELAPLDKELFDKLQEDIENLDRDIYEAKGLEVLDELMKELTEYLNSEKPLKSEFDKLVEQLQKSLEGLVEKEIVLNTDRLEELLIEARGIDASLYTEESYAALSKAVNDAEKVMSEIMTRAVVTQADVDFVVENLEKALAGLVKLDVEKPDPKPEDPVDPEDSKDPSEEERGSTTETSKDPNTGIKGTSPITFALIIVFSLATFVLLSKKNKRA